MLGECVLGVGSTPAGLNTAPMQEQGGRDGESESQKHPPKGTAAVHRRGRRRDGFPKPTSTSPPQKCTDAADVEGSPRRRTAGGAYRAESTRSR